MADFDYYGAEYGVERPSRLAEAARNFGLVNWVGALTSLGLTAGMAVWAVDLTFRDVSTVPVILAMEGPMRAAPEKPGGTVAPYQGLALSDITSGGAASPAPDQIVLAPPPVSLDAPALAERIAASEVTPPKIKAVVEDVVTASAEASADPLVGEPVPGIGAGPAGAALRDMIADARAATQGAEDWPEADGDEIASADETGEPGIAIGQSTRPRARPEGLRPAAARQPVLREVEVASADMASAIAAALGEVQAETETARVADPSEVATGTRVVQLGAFDSETVALAEWNRLDGRFGDYMAGKSRLIQKASSGGRDFWRLRVVGFDDGADARRFCSALLAQDAACIPVTVR